MTNFVLMLGPPHSGKVRIAQFLTGDHETNSISPKTHSGLTYDFTLSTKYFQSDVKLLIEEYPDSRESAQEEIVMLRSFCKEFSTDQFEELRAVLDGVVFTVKPDQAELEETLQIYSNIKDIFRELDLFFVVVAVPEKSVYLEHLEDQVAEHGMEFINFAESGTNEFKDKLGKDRLREIFESHEWTHINQQKAENDTESSPHQETETKPQKPVDLEVLLQKLDLDKKRAQELPESERKSFVDDLVDNYMEYF